MYIQEIVLKDFRNYEYLAMPFSDKTNFIVGQNGTGKTNIIEAITVLSNLRSFRNIHDSEIIRWGCSTFYCSCNVADCSNSKFEVAYNIESGLQRKKFQIDSTAIKSHVDYYGKFLTVVLSPSDIQLVQGTPELKRKYFDSVISKFDNNYLIALSDFKKAFFNRNKLLKIYREKGIIDKNEIDIWDQLFAEKASFIISARMNFIANYNIEFQNIYRLISHEFDIPFIRYHPSISSDNSDAIINELLRLRTKEILYGATSIGPQRDDFYFEDSKNRLFINYASQGQRRTAAIALKIAERNLIQSFLKEKCILLIDDIFSELDLERQKNMVGMLNNENQLIVTMVNSSTMLNEKLNVDKIYSIEKKGQISEK